MQAVILAAGRGTRMKDLTESAPKPLLEVAGKPLIQYAFEALPEEVDEVIIVVGYLGSAIQSRFGGSFGDKRLLYVEQDTLDGTGGALWRAKEILKDRFVVLMADDIYGTSDIRKCLRTSDWVELVQKRDKIKSKGKVEIDKNHNILNIIEGDHGDIPGLLSTNFFVLDTRLFNYPLVPKAAESNEFGLPQTIIAASRESGIPFKAVEGATWIEITEPEDLKKAEEILSDQA
jgi:glucose-1-phosphate thymidylyltransferase